MLAAFGEAAVAVAAILGLGRLVVRPLFRFVGGARSRELFLAAVLLVIIGTAAVTQRAGLSLALGAFLAGLLFSETEYRHQIEADIEPFKGLLLGLFFVSVGMSLDPAAVARDWAWLALSVPGLIAIKAALASALVRGAGQPWPVALEAGSCSPRAASSRSSSSGSPSRSGCSRPPRRSSCCSWSSPP
jgi:CPA2 family monovalent cation:H+ antiporter-2